MTITSKGYPGQIFPNDWANLSHLLGSEYNIHGPSHFKVTAAPGGTRQVVVGSGATPAAPHSASGKGVTDYNDAPITTAQAPVVTGGSRYDLIVLHRDWPTKTTTVQVITGTGVRALPARATRPSPQDDQPLALVRWDANNSTTPGEIVDLRVWQGDGGAVAADTLALGYLTRVGSRLRIGDDEWVRMIDSTGAPQWTTSHVSGVDLWDVNVGEPGQWGLGANPSIPLNATFKMMAGSTVQYTDGAGYARIIFPKPFPNGFITCVITAGDQSIDRAHGDMFVPGIAGGPWHTGRQYEIAYSMMRVTQPGSSTGGLRHRVNWIALGW